VRSPRPMNSSRSSPDLRSNIGLAVSGYARQKKMLVRAAETLTERDHALQGQSLHFRRLLSAKRPEIQWVGEQWPPHGRRSGGSDRQEGTGRDLQRHFRREPRGARARGRDARLVQGPRGRKRARGEPEYLTRSRDKVQRGWIVTGYLWDAVAIPGHAASLKAYQTKFNDYPRLNGRLCSAQTRCPDRRQGQVDRQQKLADAAEGIGVDTPFDPVTFRAVDRSTLNVFVGTTRSRIARARWST
jgi:branched-chain amino acid transport system substrate-binding protein